MPAGVATVGSLLVIPFVDTKGIEETFVSTKVETTHYRYACLICSKSINSIYSY